MRYLRKQAGLTLDDVSAAVGTAPSQLSLIENGKREPKLGLLKQLAAALNVGIDQLLGAEPPSRRAALEIELERYQRGPLYESLNLPKIRVSARLPLDVLESQIGLLQELERRLNEQVATPEEARRANGELRAMMRERGNYFPEYEAEAQKVLKGVGYTTGPLSQHVIADIADHLGFTLHHVGDLPHSTRSVTDLKNHRIYLTQSQRQDHDPRSVLLQALGHYVLGHETPKNYGDFLAQRVATNYFAAALLLPEHATLEFLQKAKAAKEIAVEDIRDAFAVSYETAAHRFTNLATKHLGITTHFQKTHQSGIIYKAYENDGVAFPQDHTGAIEGQPACKAWTSRAVFDVPDKFSAYSQYTDTVSGTYWCTARTERSAAGEFSLEHRRAVPAREVVPREGDDGAGYLDVSGPELLQAAAGVVGFILGRQRLAVRPRPLAPAGRHAAGRVPRRRRDRGVRVPGGALGVVFVRCCIGGRVTPRTFLDSRGLNHPGIPRLGP